MSRAERLALGTVQFGQTYGIANRSGQVSLDEASRILAAARDAGMDTLDTATAYGDSESRLGQIGVKEWKIVSKLPGLPDVTEDVAGWVESTVTVSLGRLGIDHLDGLLLHRPRQLAGSDGDRLLAGLIAVRESGMARRIGVSTYGPDDLDAVWDDNLDLVQTPFNVLDRSLVASGWLARLTSAGVEVHTRSSFLQGLLLMEERPSAFDKWSGLLTAWDEWLATHSISPVAACVGFALGQDSIDRVVVGVDSADQLRDILAIVDEPVPSLPAMLSSDDRDLIDPSRWNVT